MKTDRYTKVVFTFIAVGLFLNIAINLPVQPAFAQVKFPDTLTLHHRGLDGTNLLLGSNMHELKVTIDNANKGLVPFKIANQ